MCAHPVGENDEAGESKASARKLARYFSSNMVEQLADADRPLREVRIETVAVLFADIVDFTGLSEVKTPEQVIALLREFHARMQAVLFAHQGTLDKYLGDGLMGRRSGRRIPADATLPTRWRPPSRG